MVKRGCLLLVVLLGACTSGPQSAPAEPTAAGPSAAAASAESPAELLDQIEEHTDLVCEERAPQEDPSDPGDPAVCQLAGGGVLLAFLGDDVHFGFLIAFAMGDGRTGPWVRGGGWLIETTSPDDAAQVQESFGADLIEDVKDL